MRLHLPAGLIRRTNGPDFSDLTASTQTGPARWEEDGTVLVIPFDPEPTTEEQKLIRRRLMTPNAQREKWVADLVEARDAPITLEGVHRLLLLHTDAALRGIDEP